MPHGVNHKEKKNQNVRMRGKGREELYVGFITSYFPKIVSLAYTVLQLVLIYTKIRAERTSMYIILDDDSASPLCLSNL